jgi:small-conductance mechanosensitive channel
MTDGGVGLMIDEVRRGIAWYHSQEGVPMAHSQLDKQFEKISDKAQAATAELKAGIQKGKDQLEADVASAREKATAAAANVKGKAAGTHDQAVSQWQETREKWQDHVAKVRAKAAEKKAHHDAKEAGKDADFAESYALDAIDFALAVIQEAEYATLDAFYLRARADALAIASA